MTSNIVLECSQFQSSSTATNEWVSTFSEPVILEDGDVFQLQQAMINTKSVSSGSILIPSDTTVIITVAYYDVAMGTYKINVDPPTYNIPLPYGQVSNGVGPSEVQTRYDSLFEMPSSYTMNLTSGSPNVTNIVSTTNYPLPAGTGLVGTGIPVGAYIITVDQAAATATLSANATTTETDVSVIAGDVKNKPSGYYLLRERAQNSQGVTIPNSPLVTQDVSITIPQGSYDPNTIASMITNLVVQSIDTTIGGNTKGTLIKDGVYNSSKPMVEQKALVLVPGSNLIQSITPISFYRIKGDGSFTDRLIGASTFTLEYNDGVFSFTNFHTPIMGETVDSGSTTVYTDPSIQYLFSSTADMVTEFQIVECYGGCVITDLQPRWFWNTLGFTDAHIDTNVKFNDATFQSLSSSPTLQFDYFNQHRVRPRVISADYRSSTLVGNFWIRKIWQSEEFNTDHPEEGYYPKEYNNSQLVQSDDTFTLDGNENYIVDDSGYYRIEAVAEFSNDFKMEDGRLGAVIGVVSKNYNSNDFITGYGADSGIAFQHVGVPQTISSVKIRIIDPKTNLPVEGLGSNSTVFLEVVKAPPPPTKGK
jgi:hypothetical protein